MFTMFTSASASMFSSDVANMFTSELEKCKQMIWPTCSLVKLTGEYVGLVPGIRHLIQKMFLKILWNLQKNTRVSFWIKLLAKIQRKILIFQKMFYESFLKPWLFSSSRSVKACITISTADELFRCRRFSCLLWFLEESLCTQSLNHW